MLKGINYMESCGITHQNPTVSHLVSITDLFLPPGPVLIQVLPCVDWPSVGGDSYTPCSQIGRWAIYAIQQALL